MKARIRWEDRQIESAVNKVELAGLDGSLYSVGRSNQCTERNRSLSSVAMGIASRAPCRDPWGSSLAPLSNPPTYHLQQDSIFTHHTYCSMPCHLDYLALHLIYIKRVCRMGLPNIFALNQALFLSSQ